jgi:tetratricopeptide (TPR) repeat protein
MRILGSRDGSLFGENPEVIACPTLDVAVLRLASDAPVEEIKPPTFARVNRTISGMLKDCEAIGYPLFQRDPERKVRGTSEVHGAIYQTDGAETGRLLLREPLIRPGHGPFGDSQSPWGGLSGALVFHAGRVLGIVVEHNPRQGDAALQLMAFDALIDEAETSGDARDVVSTLGLPSATALQLVTGQPDEGSGEARQPGWPVVVGQVPGIASAFRSRMSLRDRIASARSPQTNTNDLIVAKSTPNERVGDADDLGSVPIVLAGTGGVGKTQLAASLAVQAIRDRVDLVVWVNASEPFNIVAGFAEAAIRTHAPGATGAPNDLESDARAFLKFVASTDRSWLVILDDVVDPEHAAAWWPDNHSASGWALATTRRRDPVLSGSGRRVVEVDVYDIADAHAYLTDRLTSAGRPHLLDDHAADLASALGHLPLALSHATAYMLNEHIDCDSYLRRYVAGIERLDRLMPGDPDGHGRTTDGHRRAITVTLLLALGALDGQSPVGLARPAMDLAACHDSGGHPMDFWTTEAALNFLTVSRSNNNASGHNDVNIPVLEHPMPEVTADEARGVLMLLDNYGLITFDANADDREVRVHAVTARAVFETSTLDPADVVWAAADGLELLWPERQRSLRALTQVLRTNALSVAGWSSRFGDALWDDDPHPLVWRVGNDLNEAGAYSDAAKYWQDTATTAERVLGDDHPRTLAARTSLGAILLQINQITEAIEVLERTVADYARTRGPDDPESLAARTNLGGALAHAGRTTEAIEVLNRTIADHERIHGPDAHDTLAARALLARALQRAGQSSDAIAVLEHTLAIAEPALGADHPLTLAIRGSLGNYQLAQDTAEGTAFFEQSAIDAERVRGAEHPDTLVARGALGAALVREGRADEAIALLERLVSDSTRIRGICHPDTLQVANHLASAYQATGRADDAIALLDRQASEAAQFLGSDHADVVRVRCNLAVTAWRSGRPDGVMLLEQAAADARRVLGADHPETIYAHGNLANGYVTAGRVTEAIAMFIRTVDDSIRVLGSEHRHTLAIRANLPELYLQLGRTGEAIETSERLVNDSTRIFGFRHRDTIRLRGHLGTLYRQTGRNAEAIAVLEPLIGDLTTTYGADDEDTLTTRFNVAGAHYETGDVARADELLSGLCDDFSRVLGRDHPQSQLCRQFLRMLRK